MKSDQLPIRLERVAKRLMCSTELAPYAHTVLEAAEVLRQTETRVARLTETLKALERQ
jgi:hypothetical protein